MDEFLNQFNQAETINNEKINNQNNYKMNYNQEQLNFIQSKLNDCCLLGIPGGGKTASIIGKINYHFSIGEFKKNNEFLICSFSRRACHDFIEKGQKCNKKLFNSKNVRTLHSLAGKILVNVFNKNSSSQDTVIIAASELVFENKDLILEMNEFKDLKIIFVDEAQDISQIQYDLIMKLKEITGCKVIMVGDPNQNIYQFQNGSDKFLMNHSVNKYHLVKNYRSSKQIVDFVNQFKPWDLLTPLMVSTKKEDYQKPIIFCGTVSEIVKDIIYKIKNSKYEKHNIAIIGPVKRSKPINDYYSNVGLSLMTNLLIENDISYLKHYEDTNNEEIVLNKFKKEKNHVNLMTIHGSKGLEFDEVYVLNFHITTFGMMPNEQKYNEFKYLWYVGLSRACYSMHLYIDKNKFGWFDLKNCPRRFYQSENSVFKLMNKLNFKEEIKPMYYTVTELLGSKKYFDDKHLYVFEKIIKYEVIEENLFGDGECVVYKNDEIIEYNEYCALYGIFIENIFNYYYCLKFGKHSDFFTKLKRMIHNTIIVPKNMLGGYKILKLKCPFIVKDLVRLKDFELIKKTFQKREQELYNHLLNILDNDTHKEFYLDCYNDVSHYSKEYLLKLISDLENGFKRGKSKDQINYSIFQISLFYYQKTNETAYLWKKDFSMNINSLEFIIEKTIEYAELKAGDCTLDEFIFHPTYKHSKLPIVGELDILKGDSAIIDIKLNMSLQKKSIFQLILYHNLLSPNLDKNYDLELWNFYLGKKFIIKLEKDKFMNYELLKLLSVACGEKLKNMIFIYDLETTGLNVNDDFIDIIDRHFEEYETSVIPSSGLVKLEHNPCVPFEIMELTSISSEQLLNYGCEYKKFSMEMENIFSYCEQPIFIAHNGFSFDHKIMMNKNLIDKYKARFLDSKMIIRLFLKDDVGNKSLLKIFEHLFGYSPVAHRANSDVKMLIMIMKKLGINSEKILNILN